jgi:hypothetical protein
MMALQRVKGAAISKTVWFGLALTVFGFLQNQGDVWAVFVDPKYVGLLNMGIGLVVIVLRFFTTTSLTEKGSAADSGAR